MTDAGRAVLVVILLFASMLLIVRGPPRAQSLGPEVEPERCPVAVERAGEGIVCLSEAQAEEAGLQAGDRVARDGGTGRMAPERVALFAASIDLNAASLEELAALPGVGETTARRIAGARPFSSVDELRAVPGIGAKRLSAIAPRVRVGEAEP